MFVRIIVVLSILGVAVWLLFSLTSDLTGDEKAISSGAKKSELIIIKGKEGNYKKPISKEEQKQNNKTEEEPKQDNQAEEEPTTQEDKSNYKNGASSTEKELITKNSSPIIDGKVIFDVKDWALKGEFKNILVLSISGKNGLSEDLINKDIQFSCTTNFGEKITKEKKVTLGSYQQKFFTVITTYVNPGTKSVDCKFLTKENSAIVKGDPLANPLIKTEPAIQKNTLEKKIGFPLPNL